MSETVKIPRRAMTFGEGQVTFADGGKDEPRKFKILALSGKIIKDHWWWGNFAIDLQGLKAAKKKMPVLREHERDRIVGVGETNIDETGMHVEGTFSQKTPDAAEVLALADEGFPWEASIYAVPEKIEYVERDQEAEVNGQKLKGPGAIFRKTIARETSFVTLGADKNTSAASLSDAEEFEIETEGNPLRKEELAMADEKKGKAAETPEYAAKDLVASVSLAELLEARPDLKAALEAESTKQVDEAVKTALEAEKTRIAGIVDVTPPNMEKLALAHIKDGKSVEDTKTAYLEAYKNAAPKTLGPSAEETETLEEKTELSVEDQAKKDFKEKKSIRDEFKTEGAYVAFMTKNAEGRIRILKRKDEQ